MISRWIRATGLLAMAPVAAFAFETVDTLRYPSSGAFPAYPADPAGLWSIFAYAGVMHDDNPFRREFVEESDTVLRYGAGGRLISHVVGRQRVLLEGFGEYWDYDHFSDIDHFGYGLRGEWLWEIGNNADGVAGYSRRHRHADLGEFRVERRSMITTDRWIVDGGYRFHPDWRWFAGVDYTTEERDGELSGDPRLERTTFATSLTYRTPLANLIGAALRVSNGNARAVTAVGVVTPTDYEEREIAGTLVYNLGAQLRLSGRLGQTEREYETTPQFDFSGTTYRAAVDWLPTGRLTFNLEGYREPDSSLDFDATHVIRQGASVGAAFAATFKLVFTARFINEQRLYQGDPGTALLGLPKRDDTLRTWRFAAGWEPQRHWQLSLGVDIGERTSNRVGQNYEYTQYMANLRWSY